MMSNRAEQIIYYIIYSNHKKMAQEQYDSLSRFICIDDYLDFDPPEIKQPIEQKKPTKVREIMDQFVSTQVLYSQLDKGLAESTLHDGSKKKRGRPKKEQSKRKRKNLDEDQQSQQKQDDYQPEKQQVVQNKQQKKYLKRKKKREVKGITKNIFHFFHRILLNYLNAHLEPESRKQFNLQSSNKMQVTELLRNQNYKDIWKQMFDTRFLNRQILLSKLTVDRKCIYLKRIQKFKEIYQMQGDFFGEFDFDGDLFDVLQRL